MSSATPLLDNTIEPDEDAPTGNITNAQSTKPATQRQPVVLTPGSRSTGATSIEDVESGQYGSHVVLTITAENSA